MHPAGVLDPADWPATPVSSLAAAPQPEPEIQGETVLIPQGDRRYRIRGLFANTSHQVMKVNLCIVRGDAVHVDTLDMALARQRAVFAKQASEELGIKDDIVRHDLGRMLLKLEELRDQAIQKALEPKDTTVEIGPEDRAAALLREAAAGHEPSELQMARIEQGIWAHSAHHTRPSLVLRMALAVLCLVAGVATVKAYELARRAGWFDRIQGAGPPPSEPARSLPSRRPSLSWRSCATSARTAPTRTLLTVSTISPTRCMGAVKSIPKTSSPSCARSPRIQVPLSTPTSRR